LKLAPRAEPRALFCTEPAATRARPPIVLIPAHDAANSAWIENQVARRGAGSFIFAKAKQNPDVVRESLAPLRRYFGGLYSTTSNKSKGEMKDEVHDHR
jgi:hypothetical protein